MSVGLHQDVGRSSNRRHSICPQDSDVKSLERHELLMTDRSKNRRGPPPGDNWESNQYMQLNGPLFVIRANEFQRAPVLTTPAR